MRSTFADYYEKSEKDLDDIWGRGLIVLDANVLLNLYRYPEAARSDFKTMLDQISGRLWVPHRAGLEFHRNRLTVLTEQYQKLQELETLQKELSDSVNRKTGSLKKLHILTAPGAPLAKVSQALDDFKTNIDQLRQKIDGEIADEEILKIITTILEDKIGPPYDEKQLSERYKSGDKRYKDKIPPGYEDESRKQNSKYSDAKYGDLIIWFQTIDKANEAKKPVIFVTDDEKEDWWRKGPQIGKLFGPRPELIEEFRRKTTQEFHMYTADGFMEEAKKRLKIDIKDETVQTARDVRQTERASFSAFPILNALGLAGMSRENRYPDEKTHDHNWEEIPYPRLYEGWARPDPQIEALAKSFSRSAETEGWGKRADPAIEVLAKWLTLYAEGSTARKSSGTESDDG